MIGISSSTRTPLFVQPRRWRSTPRGRIAARCQKGFAEPNKSSKSTFAANKLKKGVTLDPQKGWIPLATLSEFKSKKKSTMPVITSNGIALVLYRTQEGIFCSDANSTAYRYPMSDAKIFNGPNGPAVECPFDGTTYDLRTGQVIQWCPKNNPIRNILGTLKSKENPKPLGVYDVVIADDGMMFAKLF